MQRKNNIFMTINYLFKSSLWYYSEIMLYFDVKISEMRIDHGN